MGETPSPVEESVRSLPQEEEPTDSCDEGDRNVVSASEASLPPTEPGTTNELRVSVADAALPNPEGDHETPEIAPPTTANCSTAIQNDASPTNPSQDSCVAESQDETERFATKRDSGLASIDLEFSQQPGLTAAPAVSDECQPQKPEAHISESQEQTTGVTGPDDMPETVGSTAPPAAQIVKPVAADARSITARSIGGRSLIAASTISPEDEVLSLRVRSLYDSGVGGLGSEVSSQFSSDINSRRISSIIEESANAGVSRMRGTRSSFPGASRDVARRSRMGGSVEGGTFVIDYVRHF
jgi:hypothetical protein